MFIHIIAFLLDQLDHKSNPKKLNMKREKKGCECQHPQHTLTFVEIVLQMLTSVTHFFINIVYKFF